MIRLTNSGRECLVKLLRQPPQMLQQEDFIDFVKGMQKQLQRKGTKQSYLIEEIQSIQIQLASVQVQPLHVQQILGSGRSCMMTVMMLRAKRNQEDDDVFM
jgi:hypothetical protein